MEEEWKNKGAENVNTEVKNLKIVLQNRSWVNFDTKILISTANEYWSPWFPVILLSTGLKKPGRSVPNTTRAEPLESPSSLLQTLTCVFSRLAFDFYTTLMSNWSYRNYEFRSNFTVSSFGTMFVVHSWLWAVAVVCCFYLTTSWSEETVSTRVVSKNAA